MAKIDKRTKAYRDSLKSNNEVETTTYAGPLEGVEPVFHQPVYKATLKMNDTVYTGEGETIKEAIEAIKPEVFKTLAYLTIETGNKKAEMRFGVFQCKRLFTNTTVREIKSEMFRRLLV